MPFANGQSEIAYHLRVSGDPEDMITTTGMEYELGSVPTAGDLTAAYDAFNDNWVPLLDTGYTFAGLTWRGRTTSGTAFDSEVFSASAGTRVGSVLPQNCAMLLRKRTGLAGRANRGRMYVPGIVQTTEISEVGVIQPTPLAALQTAATAFVNDLIAIPSASPAILHPAGTVTPYEDLVVDETIATQRRRLRP